VIASPYQTPIAFTARLASLYERTESPGCALFNNYVIVKDFHWFEQPERATW
jgi:hypothetical protein